LTVEGEHQFITGKQLIALHHPHQAFASTPAYSATKEEINITKARGMKLQTTQVLQRAWHFP